MLPRGYPNTVPAHFLQEAMLCAALDTLTETQRRRLDMREIARTEGKRLMTIRDSLVQIGKKYVALKKISEKTLVKMTRFSPYSER